MELFGNTAGLATSEIRALERIYRRRVPFEVLVTHELTRSLCDFSHATGRQVGALVDRGGTVTHVVVGDAAKLMLPDFGRLRAAKGRFRGLRLIHTHLRSEPLTRDDLVDLTRLRLDMIAAICLFPEGTPMSVHYAHCVPLVPVGAETQGEKESAYRQYGPIPYHKLDCNPSEIVPALEAEFARIARTREVSRHGRAILVHVADRRNMREARTMLSELRELARTAGVEVADVVLQVRDAIDPKYVLGRGKVEEVVLRAIDLDAELLIFARELSPSQSAAIAALTDLKVVDRTQLILDIFAQHAESNDGKLQVELAQMKYLLPRLGLRDDALSRLTGGIGGRGPGETKLEIGKRRARERVSHLETQLAKLAQRREQRRRRRVRHDVPTVAIVGYTNAGKSTLLNTLTESTVVAEDKLFATLDPRSRRLRLPEEQDVIITDTVGFIRELPEDLFAAFRATFEEVRDADVIVQVVDASTEDLDRHLNTTDKLLGDLDLGEIPRVLCLNKVDLIEPAHAAILARSRDGILVSAFDASSLSPLLTRISSLVGAGSRLS